MKVLFTYDYKEEAFKQVRALGYEVHYWPEGDMGAYPNPESVDILICYNPFSRIDLRDYKQLKYILLSSIGFDQLPKDLAQALGIKVCNNRGGYSIPMGEWIVMKLLELSRNSRQMYLNQEVGLWQMDTGVEEVYKKRLVFFGTGTIAHEAVKRLQGFDMTLIGLNTRGDLKPYFDHCYPMSQSIDQVKLADAIVIALPLTQATQGYFDQAHIEAMQNHAILINVARGEILDEDYLTQALSKHKIKAAALDVFHEDPLPRDHKLWTLDNVSITCHNSWVSEKRNERRFEKILDNLSRLKSNEPLINLLDLERGY